jgi:DNA mismatch endonuclease, patch repair protein
MEKLLRTTLPGGSFTNVPNVRSKTMASIKGKHNRSTERQFRMALVRAGITRWKTHANLPGKPDIFFPRAKVAIFLDGCFWHGCSSCGHIPKTNSLFWQTKIGRNRERDRRNSILVKKEGITVIRVWEHSLNDPVQLRKTIKRIQDILLDRTKHAARS